MHLPPGARERLLQLGLVVDVARPRVLDPLAERLDDRALDALEPVLEVDRRDRGLEHCGEDVATARDPLELVGRRLAGELEQPLAERELLRDRRAALTRDDVRADLREPTLGGRREAIEHRARDRELEDAVAQELQPLVRLRAVLGPRRVREDLLQATSRQPLDQPAELGRPGLRRRVSPGAR